MHSILSNHKPKPSLWEFEAIGTHWRIETPVSLAPEVRADINERIGSFDKTYSRFREDSMVTKMSKTAGEYEFPADSIEIINFYRRLYDVTDGAVTPLIGGVLAESGYDKEYSLIAGSIGTTPQWDDSVMKWEQHHVTTAQPIVFDIGAAGKGYIVDCIGELLEQRGISEYVIDASGDIRRRGSEIERIGLENPYDTTSVIGLMNLQNASLCASAINRRKWGNDMHHIIDPRTSAPTRDVVASWVVAESTMLADGLTTALFFVDGPTLQKTWDFQYVRLMADGKLSHSHEFVGELFI